MQLSARPIGAERIVVVRHVTFVLILMAGILMRVQAFVYNRSFWLDEANLALNVVARSFGQLATPLDYEQGAPVGFLWLSKAVILLLGNHDYILRLVPFLAALLSLLLMARLIQDIPPAASGYVALLLYAVGSRTAYYATEFKQYSTDTVIALLLLVLAVPCLSGSGGPGVSSLGPRSQCPGCGSRTPLSSSLPVLGLPRPSPGSRPATPAG